MSRGTRSGVARRGRDVDLATHGEQGAGRASGPAGDAPGLAERDEAFVDLDPIAYGERADEGDHRLLGGGSVDVAPAVGDPVDVDIDGDRRPAEADGQGQRRDLGADAPEGGQPFERVGHNAPVLTNDPPGDLEEVAGLGLGEAGASEEPDQLGLRDLRERPRGPGDGEEAEADLHRRLVAGRAEIRLPTSCSNGEPNPRSRRSNIAALGRPSTASRRRRKTSSMSNGSFPPPGTGSTRGREVGRRWLMAIAVGNSGAKPRFCRQRGVLGAASIPARRSMATLARTIGRSLGSNRAATALQAEATSGDSVRDRRASATAGARNRAGRRSRAIPSRRIRAALSNWSWPSGMISCGTPAAIPCAAVPTPPWWTIADVRGRSWPNGAKGTCRTPSGKSAGTCSAWRVSRRPRRPSKAQASAASSKNVRAWMLAEPGVKAIGDGPASSQSRRSAGIGEASRSS